MTEAPDIEAMCARARDAIHSGRAGEAVAIYREVLRRRGPYFEAYQNLAIALSHLGRIDEAITVSGRLLERNPNRPMVWANHSILLARCDRLQEAVAATDRALELLPDYYDVRLKKALYLLALGRYREGFELAERRWEDPKWLDLRRQFSQPLWTGAEPLRGTRLLVHSERGFGDIMQQVRYARLAAEAGASVMLEVPPVLKPLLAGTAFVDGVFAVGERLPDFDRHCAFSALPWLFGTTLDAVPAPGRYLTVPAGYRDKWASLFDGAERGLRIGFAFRGNVAHSGGRDDRPIPLGVLARLIAATPHRWYCLQRDAGVGERAFLRDMPNVVDLGERLDDWGDTAAIVDRLDLVVSIDTALAHLAGALGKPLWVLSQFAPSWQWRPYNGAPAWYPAAEVLRQPLVQDWKGLISEILASRRLEAPVVQ